MTFFEREIRNRAASQLAKLFSDGISGRAVDHAILATSKMSHDVGWREACVSTTRDRPWRWLWRLVRHLGGPRLLQPLLLQRDR